MTTVSPPDLAAEPRKLLLRISHPAHQTTWLPLTQSRIVLGRAEDVDVPLDSHTVSRWHAELVRDPFDRWWIRDRDSRNGTRVNGAKVSQCLVRPGDLLQIGEFSLALCPSAAPMETTVTQTDMRLSIMQSLPDQIHRLREFESPKIGHEHLSAVLEFGQSLNTIADPGERMARLCDLVLCRPFPGKSAVILRASREVPERMQILHGPVVAAPTRASATVLEPAPISASVMRAVCEVPEPVLATNLAPELGNVALSVPAEVMLLSVAAVPLRFDDHTIDVIYLSLAPECAHSDWLALVSLAVKQFQQAESVWANVNRIREYAALDRELERAQQIQQKLIPTSVRIEGLEAAVGFRPCNWVGGDYVDVLKLNDGRVLLVVADVVGKGLPAALVASSLHTMVHAAARAGEGLPALPHTLNEYVCDYLGEQSFAATICIVLDLATGQCECVCAGHPAGLVISPGGKVRQLNTFTHPPLGVDRMTLNVTTDQLAPGDMLALFTDGVTELRCDSGEMLGEQGLGEGLAQLYAAAADRPLSDLADGLNQILDSFRGGGIATDDRTFLLARLGGKIA